MSAVSKSCSHKPDVVVSVSEAVLKHTANMAILKTFPHRSSITSNTLVNGQSMLLPRPEGLTPKISYSDLSGK